MSYYYILATKDLIFDIFSISSHIEPKPFAWFMLLNVNTHPTSIHLSMNLSDIMPNWFNFDP